MTQESKPFLVRMREYFGLLSDQSNLDFLAELKRLSYQEKLDFAAMLNAAGYPTDAPAAPAVAA